MRIVVSLLLVLIAAVPAFAQGRPKACRYVIDIENAQVAATTDPKTACNYGGKILMTLNNLDNAKYRLEMRNFKFDAGDPTKCASPTTAAGTLPINEPDKPGIFEFKINEEVSKTKKKPIKALGSQSTECFKFDLWLYTSSGSVPIHKLDPEIQITEPPPPPPGPPKKPGDGR
jgi:hypothetical protein